MFIDTHCHLNFKDFNGCIPEIIGNAKKAGVKKFLIPGTGLSTSASARKLRDRYPDCVMFSVGIHPYDASKNPDVTKLTALIGEGLAAVGECGLDYHMYKGFPAVGKKDEQKQLFYSQLQLAATHSLPIIIHCRDAFDEIFDVLDALPSIPRGVFHCFSGGLSQYREVEKRGFFIGFDGNITYSKHLQMIVPSIPIEKILLETDAPYLTPVPHRGTRNEPKYIPLIAKKIAGLKQCSLSEVECQTTVNALSLFHFS